MADALIEKDAEVTRKDETIAELRHHVDCMNKKYQAVLLHAVNQDCGRICDAHSSIKYGEQLARSLLYVENLAKQALQESE